MSLTLELRLEEAEGSRVKVALLLTPTGGPVAVEGAALELRAPSGERLGARLVLPIAGQLAGPVGTKVELRTDETLPRGAVVHGVVWSADELLEVEVPTDPCTDLLSFLHADRHVASPPRAEAAGFDDPEPLPLSRDDRRALANALPWLPTFRMRRPEPEGPRILEEASADVARDAARHHGLSPEDEELLRDLLDDEPLDEGDPWGVGEE